MAEKREYKPGIRKIKDFFKNFKVNPNSPKARLQRQKEQKLRAKGIGTSSDTDTEFKGSVKNLTKKGMARKMEDAKPKVTVGAPKAKVGPSRASKPSTKSKPGVGAKRARAGLSEFGKAFAAARKAGKKDFTFRDKQYAAITKQEVQKAGASGLGDYLNKLKRKDSKIVKAPGQVTKKKGGMAKYQEGGVVSRKEMRELRKMIPSDNPITRAAAMRERLAERARQRNIDLKNQSGAAVSENEMKSIMEQMGKSPAEDKFATGGSVMSRGCKMGRKKPTKLY